MQKITPIQLNEIKALMDLLYFESLDVAINAPGIEDDLKDFTSYLTGDQPIDITSLSEKEAFVLNIALIKQLKTDVLRSHVIHTAVEYNMYGIGAVKNAGDNLELLDNHLNNVGLPPFYSLSELQLNDLVKTIERLGRSKQKKESEDQTQNLLDELNMPTEPTD